MDQILRTQSFYKLYLALRNKLRVRLTKKEIVLRGKILILTKRIKSKVFLLLFFPFTKYGKAEFVIIRFIDIRLVGFFPFLCSS